MEKNSELCVIKKDDLDKVAFILKLKKEDQTPNDLIIQYQLKVFFTLKDDKYVFNFKNDNNLVKIIVKIIDLLYLIFRMTKSERQNFYNKRMNDIEKDSNFLMVINELEQLKSFDINFRNKKFKDLFDYLSLSFYSKDEYSLSEYIDYFFFKLSFIQKLESLFKIQLYSIIINFYLVPLKVIIDFNEKNIVLSDLCIDLVNELFTNEQTNFQSLTKSIIILNYAPISNLVNKYNLEDILKGIDSMYHRCKNMKEIEDVSISVEKIMMMFIDELNRQKYAKAEKVEISCKEEIVKKENEIENEDKSKDNKNSILLNNEAMKFKKKETKEIINAQNTKNDSEENKSEKLKLYIDNIIKYLNINNMGNENINNEILKMQKLVQNVIEDNNEMKIKMKQMKEEMDEMKGTMGEMENNISKLKKDNNTKSSELKSMKENMGLLNTELKDIKEILANIQCRDLSKAFLRSFGSFLTYKDWMSIRKDRTMKGKIIFKRIEQLYPKADQKKMNLLKQLIENSSELIQKGNNYAHTLTLEKYESQMESYKKGMKKNNLSSPLIFCFLMTLEISGNLFNEAYLFLTEFFDAEMQLYDEENYLSRYFN